MSHAATNWAVSQRGLSPATKIVLWHLADHHNPSFGCFPSQLQLAADAEMSKSTINVHLRILEERGLIRRLRRYDPQTNRSLATRYILRFEPEFTQEPSPNPGLGNPEKPSPNSSESRVRNSDSNPVREPVSTTAGAGARIRAEADPAVALCLAAAGPGLTDASRDAIRATDAVVAGWIARGFDLEEDIVPAIRMRTQDATGRTIRSWSYFAPLIARLHARRTGQAEAKQIAPNRGKRNPPDETSIAPQAAPSTDRDADRLKRLAAWIKGDGYLPPSAVSNTTRDELLRRGLVEPADLRRRQIY